MGVLVALYHSASQYEEATELAEKSFPLGSSCVAPSSCRL